MAFFVEEVSPGPDTAELAVGGYHSDSFEDFAAAEMQGLLRYATVLTASPDLAGDLVQDVMMRVYKKWAHVKDADNPVAYVKKMVTNEHLSWRRRWHVRTIIPTDEVTLHERAPARADAAQGVVERHALWQRLAELPPRQRAVLVLRYYEGLPDAEIAQALSCSAGTVRSHACRALATLRIDAQTLEER